jgi:hypothetical protein
MKFTISLNHVAVLVPSAQRAANYLSRFNFQIDAAEEIASEGTCEIYVERDKKNSLLLMEAISPGPYQRALQKRGPGIHHLAIDVKDLESYLQSLVGTGWLLHPISIKMIARSRTAFLCRPGFPALIEVQERKDWIDAPLFVESICLPIAPELTSLIKFIGLNEIVKPTSGATTLTLAGNTISLGDLFV